MGGRGPKAAEGEAKVAQQLAKNERRRAARAADPTYATRAAGYQRRYTETNRNTERLRKRAWMNANPHQKRVNRQARRAAERAAPGQHTRRQVETILDLQQGRCAYCDAADDLHLDHVIPLARGGSNWPWNLQWLCSMHNIAKGAKTDSEYREEIGLPIVIWHSLRLWAAALMLSPAFLVPEARFPVTGCDSLKS